MKLRLPPPALRIKTRREKPEAWISRNMRSGLTMLVPYGAIERCKSLEDRRAMLVQYLAETPAGGCLIAAVRCCDSGKELVDRLYASGTVLGDLPILDNQDIVRLKPTMAEYIHHVSIFRNRGKTPQEKLAQTRSFVGTVLAIETENVNVSLPDIFPVTRLDVGLIWEKND